MEAALGGKQPVPAAGEDIIRGASVPALVARNCTDPLPATFEQGWFPMIDCCFASSFCSLLLTDAVGGAAGGWLLAFGMPSGWEWIVLLVIGLLIFGRRLPEVGRSLGRGIVEFKKGIKGIEEEIDEASDADQSGSSPSGRGAGGGDSRSRLTERSAERPYISDVADQSVPEGTSPRSGESPTGDSAR